MNRLTRRHGLALLLGTLLATTAGCGLGGSTLPDYSYRLTIEVETPEGIKTGSTIVTVSTYKAGKNSIPTPGAISFRVTGEAAVIDLGSRGLLFALLRSEEEPEWAPYLLMRLARQSELAGDEGYRATFNNMINNTRPVEIPYYYKIRGLSDDYTAWPMFVYFKDMKRPETVTHLDPRDMSKEFGVGVKVKRIYAQITKDKPLHKIKEYLPWIDNMNFAFLRIEPKKFVRPVPFAADIYGMDFKRS